jgi:hypothetical protein
VVEALPCYLLQHLVRCLNIAPCTCRHHGLMLPHQRDLGHAGLTIGHFDNCTVVVVGCEGGLGQGLRCHDELTKGCAAAYSDDIGVASLRPELCLQLTPQLQAANLLILLLCHLHAGRPRHPGMAESSDGSWGMLQFRSNDVQNPVLLQHAHLMDLSACQPPDEKVAGEARVGICQCS